VSVTPLSVNLGDPFLKCTLDARAEPAVRATNKKARDENDSYLGQ
jgi:hypothetical protein